MLIIPSFVCAAITKFTPKNKQFFPLDYSLLLLLLSRELGFLSHCFQGCSTLFVSPDLHLNIYDNLQDLLFLPFTPLMNRTLFVPV